jgi:hypothetical protein
VPNRSRDSSRLLASPCGQSRLSDSVGRIGRLRSAFRGNWPLRQLDARGPSALQEGNECPGAPESDYGWRIKLQLLLKYETKIRMPHNSIIAAIDSEIERLQEARVLLSNSDDAKTKATAPTKAPTRRRLSTAARRRIADAQRKRWAEQKAGKTISAKAAKKPTRPARKATKPKLSAAARMRIAAAQKKRWAAIRAEKKAAKISPAKKAARRALAKKVAVTKKVLTAKAKEAPSTKAAAPKKVVSAATEATSSKE